MRLLAFFFLSHPLVHDTAFVSGLPGSIARPSLPLRSSVPSVVILSRGGRLRRDVFGYLISRELPQPLPAGCEL